MSCSAETETRAREIAGLFRAFAQRDPLFHWRTAAKAFWPDSRRRRPVALIRNTLHERIYQCLACGAELSVENHHRLTKAQTARVAEFSKHHNAQQCLRDLQ